MRAKVQKTQKGGPADTWDKESARDVYAVGYRGGEILILVADDNGKLQWVQSDYYTVLPGEEMLLPRRP